MDIAEKLLLRIDANNTLAKMKKKRGFKNYYMNGDFRILGSPSIPGLWNSLMFKLWLRFRNAPKN